MRHDSQLVSYLRLRTQGASTLILRVSPYKSGWGWSRRSCRQEPVWFMRSEVLVPIRERLPCPPAPWSSTTTMYLPACSLVNRSTWERARGDWKSGPDTVWLSIIRIYSRVCCVIGRQRLPRAIAHQAWEQLGDNRRGNPINIFSPTKDSQNTSAVLILSSSWRKIAKMAGLPLSFLLRMVMWEFFSPLSKLHFGRAFERAKYDQ